MRLVSGLLCVGIAVLVLLLSVKRDCERHPFFTLAGTVADCAVSEGPDVVAKLE